MCDECDKLDEKIQHYRRIVDPAMDPVTRQRIAKLIEDLNAEKAKLHREQEQ